MSSEEFYVSKILEAKVVNVGSRTKLIKCWAYLVEWADYEDLTWEPEENFRGSRSAVKTFWQRAAPKLNGRTHADLRKFKVGEIVELPTEYVRKPKPGHGSACAALVNGSRVFALWPETQHYYPAVVQRRIGKKYEVRFDEDESEATVALNHMRLCSQLRAEDTVVLKSDTAKISAVKPDGSLRIKKRLHVADLSLSAWCVAMEWKDRKLTHKDIICAADA